MLQPDGTATLVGRPLSDLVALDHQAWLLMQDFAQLAKSIMGHGDIGYSEIGI
jgi:hypothetical protein